MATGEVKRAVRVAERVRHELADLLRNLRDPRLEGATISTTSLTDDLQLAKIYVRILTENPESIDARRKKELLRGFEAAAPRLRRDLSQALKLRYAPQLRFYYDEGVEASGRVDELLREIEEDRKRVGEDD